MCVECACGVGRVTADMTGAGEATMQSVRVWVRVAGARSRVANLYCKFVPYGSVLYTLPPGLTDSPMGTLLSTVTAVYLLTPTATREYFYCPLKR